MTQEEDAANAAANEIISRCNHVPMRFGGELRCQNCGCRFAVMMLPRIAPVYRLEREPEEYYAS